jgi:hypothetical protein
MHIIFSPRWFYGGDIIIDAVSMFVLLLIAFFTIRAYLISKNKKYLYLGLSFLIISTAFLFEILMNFTIYYKIIETRRIGIAEITIERWVSSDNLVYIGTLLSRLLVLIGAYLLYLIYTDQDKLTTILTSFLLAVTVFCSRGSHIIFFSTSFMLFLLISIKLSKIYRKSKHSKTKLLISSFIIIALSQLMFLFLEIDSLSYVIAEGIQLFGYVLMLITFIMVLRHGKEKIQD